MSGPTTAAQLVDLALHELGEVHRRSSTRDRASAPELAAGWPGFLGSAERLVQVLRDQRASAPGRSALDVPLAAGEPNANLQRAADYLGAAADLVGTRDRSLLTAQQRDADADDIAQHLAVTALLVTVVTAPHPALLDTTVSAATAAGRWRRPAAAHVPRGRAARSLADATTLASAPPEHTSPDVGTLAGALHDWQQAAVAMAHAPAPSRADLLGAARTAGMLTRLSQVLLLAHADPVGASDAVARSSESLRRAGRTWNAAAEVWRHTATGGAQISPELRAAGAALESAVRRFARSGSDWASAQDLRAKATPELALHVVRAALTAVQSVAEHHAPLVARLGQTGALYTQAKQLPVPDLREEPEQRVTDRLAGRWIPLDTSESAPLVAAYQRLPAAAAAGRTALTGTAVTDPAAPRPGMPREQPAGATAEQTREHGRNTDPLPVTLAGQRWQQTLAAVDPRLLQDPHYPALAAALDRVQLAGADVAASLAAAATGPLPDEHTARALHYQLVSVCPAAITPFTVTPDMARPPVQPTTRPAAAAAAALQPGGPAPTPRR